MKVLVTGASGFVGRNVTAALMGEGHHVIPVSRKYGVDFGQMLSVEQWLPHLNDVGAVVNCVGIIGEKGTQRFDTLHSQAPQALFQACQQAGVTRVIQISALGADDKAFSHYHKSKRAADDYLRGLPIKGFVLRPSLIYGKGGSSSKVFMQLSSLPVISLIGDGQQALQPVHISDVAAAVMQCFEEEAVPQTLDVVGPHVVTYQNWLQANRDAQGLGKGRFIKIPMSLMMMVSKVGRYFNPMLQPENLQMLQAGSFADASPLMEFLGRAPQAAKTSLFFADASLVGAER